MLFLLHLSVFPQLVVLRSGRLLLDSDLVSNESFAPQFPRRLALAVLDDSIEVSGVVFLLIVIELLHIIKPVSG